MNFQQINSYINAWQTSIPFSPVASILNQDNLMHLKSQLLAAINWIANKLPSVRPQFLINYGDTDSYQGEE